MIELSLDFITGLMIGMEFPPARELHEDMAFCMVVDLAIIRFTLVYWDREN